MIKHLVAAALGIMLANSAFAGSPPDNYASCYKYADGSGYCQGTLQGFRNSSGADDLVSILTYSRFSGFEELSFYARHLNINYTCESSSSLLLTQARAISGTNFVFRIEWNTSGTCTGLYHWATSTAF
jgi:hypothetical protein